MLKLIIVAGVFFITGILATIFLFNGDDVTKTNYHVADIIGVLPYYSQELAEICIPASGKSLLSLAENAEDVKKKDVLSAVTAKPSKSNNECIRRFCEESEANPDASANGYLISKEICHL